MNEREKPFRKKKPGRSSRLKFGDYRIPFTIHEKELTISVEKEEGHLIYKRDHLGKTVNKIILSNMDKIMINPVEPVNIPKKITSYYLVEFENSLMIEPEMKKKVYLKFPIEIGIFIEGKDENEILDIITFTNQKYTLYGDLKNGVICRHYMSKILSSIPSIDIIHNGIMELQLYNSTDEWVELTKAVFNACGMTLYYNENRVAMKATIKITSEKYAVTNFFDTPLRKGMKKSIELYTPKTVSLFTPKFTMEGGL
ncbi:MAG: DUF432 domain-containing protein [Candidatus Thermoplasmatota archaeon]|jgi:hypothetical protein|nr:DUF432 domain-containing protein [Candidatus Thermoplasmatota archaeon]